MSSQSHRRTLPLATALLALALLTTPAVPAIAADNTSGEPPPPNFPTAVPTHRGALTQPADTHASVAPAATNAHSKRNRRSADANVGSSRPVPVDPKVAYASYWGGSGAEGCEPTPWRGRKPVRHVRDRFPEPAAGRRDPVLPRPGRRLRRQARSQRQAHHLRDLSRISGRGRYRGRRRGRPRPPLRQRLRCQRLPDDARRLRHHLQRRRRCLRRRAQRGRLAAALLHVHRRLGPKTARARWRSTTTAAS